MELLRGVEGGDWLLSRVGSWATPGGVAGTGFEAYARILHPTDASLAHLGIVDEWGIHPRSEPVRWRWSQIAQRNDKVMHPLVQWQRLTVGETAMSFADGWRLAQSHEGWLPPDLLSNLTEHLAAATNTPGAITVGVWDGWGLLQGSVAVAVNGQTRGEKADRALAEVLNSVSPDIRRAVRSGPFLAWPGRNFILLATSLTELADPTWIRRAGLGWRGADTGVLPQLLWPADRTWVVASEIDWDFTIVAGPRALIDSVLSDDRFESFKVTQDSDLSWEGDTLNTD